MTTTIGQLIDNDSIDVAIGFASGQHNQEGIGTPHMRPFNVTPQGTVSLKQVKSVPSPGDAQRYLLKRGDILFNNTNTEDLVGKTAYWHYPDSFAFSNHMTRIRVKATREIVPQFLAFALHHHWQVGDSRLLCRRHVAQASIIGERFREIALPLFDVATQERVAVILWKIKLAGETDTLLAQTARSLKRATMQQLFTNGLRGDSQKITQFGEVPESWEIMPLNSCAYVQTGATKGREISDADALEVPYLRVANVQDGHLDLTEMKTIRIRKSELDGFFLRRDDVVLTEGGDFDKLGRGFIWEGQIEQCIHQNHIFAVRVNREKLLPRYFAYFCRTHRDSVLHAKHAFPR